MKYRPEIDGLRAVAVLPVILFHAGASIFSGGFIGVDVFFVISGFLITTIILNEKEAGSFTLKNFYLRRARRILPALFTVIIASIPLAWAFMLPTQLKDFSQSIVAAVFSFSNFHFWKSSGYFADAADEKPMLHTWSLAVEEQYYIFFPLLILFLWKTKRDIIPHVLIAVALFSLALSEYVSRHYEDANFYLLHTRAWELFAGSITAVYIRNKTQKTSNLLSLTGLSLIIFSIFAFDSSYLWPSLYTLVPVLGTVLIIIFAAPETLASKILSMRVFVGIGLISYSAYLWHQPLFAYARIISLEEPSIYLMLGLAVASIFLAFLTWKYIETPFRKRQFTLFSPAKGLAASLLIILAFGLTGNISKGANWRYPEEIEVILDAKNDYAHPKKLCDYSEKRKDVINECWLNSSTKKDTLLLGDSHANGLIYELNKSLAKLDVNLKHYTQSSCPPIPNIGKVDKGMDDKCYIYNSQVTELLNSTQQYKTIILHARWAIRVEGETFDNGEGGVDEAVYVQFDTVGEPKFANRKTRILEAYKDFVIQLLQEGKNVVLVYPVPEAGWSVPEHTAKIALIKNKRETISTSYEVFKKRNNSTIEAFDSIQHPNLYRLYPHKYLCSEETGRCMNATLDEVYYKDDDHLSNAGVRLFADDLAKLIKSIPTN